MYYHIKGGFADQKTETYKSCGILKVERTVSESTQVEKGFIVHRKNTVTPSDVGAVRLTISVKRG